MTFNSALTPHPNLTLRLPKSRAEYHSNDDIGKDVWIYAFSWLNESPGFGPYQLVATGQQSQRHAMSV